MRCAYCSAVIPATPCVCPGCSRKLTVIVDEKMKWADAPHGPCGNNPCEYILQDPVSEILRQEDEAALAGVGEVFLAH